jgi:hypothetical protein
MGRCPPFVIPRNAPVTQRSPTAPCPPLPSFANFLGAATNGAVMTPRQSEPSRHRRTSEVGRTGARFGSIKPSDSLSAAAELAARAGVRVGSSNPNDSPLAAAELAARAGARVGSTKPSDPLPAAAELAAHTGARFGPITTNDQPSAPVEPSAPTGARFGPHSQRRRKRADPPSDPTPGQPAQPSHQRRAPETVSQGRSSGSVPGQPERLARRGLGRDEGGLPSESGVLTRPYARTGGRTRPAIELAIEALVSARPGAARGSSWEQRAIASLCVRPRSVAEVAALLVVPLGVARVLLVDMVMAGAVVVHGSGGQRAPDLVLMRRVLAGLRRL